MTIMTTIRCPLFLVFIALSSCTFEGGSGQGGDSYDFEYCEDGQIKVATCHDGLCDPAPFVRCEDGLSECAESEQACGYHLSVWCEDNSIVEEYCSSLDTSCWGHEEYEVCDDGSCRTFGPCPYEYEYCSQDGVVMTNTCSEGFCDPLPFQICDDGGCVLGDEPCGYEYEYCEDSVVHVAICTGGLCDPAPFSVCADESCVLFPEVCPEA